jgi:CRISPR/Cas system-associated protein Cas5 (RAMP superfamily)
MKVYEVKYTGISMGFLIVPQSYVEDERTQQWFKEFDRPPVDAIELNPDKVYLGNKSLSEIEKEAQEVTE